MRKIRLTKVSNIFTKYTKYGTIIMYKGGTQMKLLLIIISNEDANAVSKVLLKEKYFVTKLSSTGGLLKNGNTTLIVGIENDQVANVVNLVGEVSKPRKQTTSTILPDEYSMISSLPFQVSVGGATIFVLDVENMYKI